MPNLTDSFDFEIENSCEETRLVERDQIASWFKIYALETQIKSYKYLSYTDQISDQNSLPGSCGPIIYTILDVKGNEVSGEEALVSV